MAAISQGSSRCPGEATDMAALSGRWAGSPPTLADQALLRFALSVLTGQHALVLHESVLLALQA